MNRDDGQVIRYIDGVAWGIAPTGRTVYLGTEDYIRSVVSGAARLPRDPVVAQVLKLERALREKIDKLEQRERQREAEARKQRHQRAVELGVARRRGRQK